MTLIVSLRIAEGTVIAGDSYSTVMSTVNVLAEEPIKCEECGEDYKTQSIKEYDSQCPKCDHVQKIPVPGALTLPGSTFSFAQKVFPFLDSFGVGTYGAGQISSKTIFFAIRELEAALISKKWKPKNPMEVGDKIGQHIQGLLKNDIPDIDSTPDDWFPVGFQIVGYEKSKPQTIEIKVGKKIQSNLIEGMSCTVTGQQDVSRALWKLSRETYGQITPYHLFSLQDAVDYAEYLIKTTANFQRFSSVLPTVGGDIDIALVTPFDGFKWIQQKSLSEKIGDKNA